MTEIEKANVAKAVLARNKIRAEKLKQKGVNVKVGETDGSQ